MNLLLDSHTFLWFINDAPELSSSARELLETNDGDLFLSVASLWEIAIKISIGKLSIEEDFASFLSEHIAINRISLLPVTMAHLKTLIGLPHHHRDPFDRLIIAQALTENFPVIGRDVRFDAYKVARYW